MSCGDEDADPRKRPNYLFYTNQIESLPDGDLIDTMHKTWWGNYSRLERHHGFIQWLFPVFESSGMNWESKSLTKEEAKLIRHDLACAKRVVMSYRLILDFWGFKLLNEETDRVLTCLGHLGFTRYKEPFFRALDHEVNVTQALRNAKQSCDRFWKATLDVDSDAFKRKTKEMPEDREDSVFFAWLEEKKQASIQDAQSTSA